MTASGGEAKPAEEYLEVSHILGKSADRAKGQGNVYLLLTVMIGSGVLSLFAFSGLSNTSAPNPFQEMQVRQYESIVAENRPAQIKDFLSNVAQINAIAGADQEERKELFGITNQMLRPLPIPISNNSAQNQISSLIGSSVVRIGSVLIGIFLIQIMVGFSRYYYRLAEHLRVCAAALRLTKGDLTYMEGVIPLLMPSNLEFGKIPNSPVEKIVTSALQAISELSKKIPTK